MFFSCRNAFYAQTIKQLALNQAQSVRSKRQKKNVFSKKCICFKDFPYVELRCQLFCLGNISDVPKPELTSVTIKLCQSSSNMHASNMFVLQRISTQTWGCNIAAAATSPYSNKNNHSATSHNASNNSSRCVALATLLSQHHWPCWLRSARATASRRQRRPNSFQVIFCAYGLC